MELVDTIDTYTVLHKIEQAGRLCYKSESKNTLEDAERFIRHLLTRGHESVIEHQSLTFRFTTDRAIANEIVRHRIASYSQVSTRYFRYQDDIPFIRQFDEDDPNYDVWVTACENAEKSYRQLLEKKATPEFARSVLPLCTETELYMTANLREWRHFLKLRMAKGAHPIIRELSRMIYEILKEKLPVIVFDLDQ